MIALQANELSKDEMLRNVPILLQKLCAHRPLASCFVGKVVWDTIAKAMDNWTATGSAWSLTLHPSNLSDVVPAKGQDPAVARGTVAKRKTVKKIRFAYGFQPYRLVHPGISEAVGVDSILTVVTTAR